MYHWSHCFINQKYAVFSIYLYPMQNKVVKRTSPNIFVFYAETIAVEFVPADTIKFCEISLL